MRYFRDRTELRDRYVVVDQKLSDIVESMAELPSWHVACDRMRRCTDALGQGGFEERLAAWRDVRESGLIPDEAAFFLVADEIALMTTDRLEQILDEVDRLANSLGLRLYLQKYCRYGGGFDCLRHAFPADWDRLYMELLAQKGEAELSHLFRTNRDLFDEKLSNGRSYFYATNDDLETSPEELNWFEEFLNAVKCKICIPTLGWPTPALFVNDVKEYTSCTEVILYLAPGEVMDKPDLEDWIDRVFVLDVLGIKEVFDSVGAAQWELSGRGLETDEGILCVQGKYRGNAIVLHVVRVPTGYRPEDDPIC